jgi:hypothetical protein
MTTIKLKKIYLTKLSKDKKRHKRKIKKHPYYISLLHNKQRKYEKYIQLSKYQSKKPSAKWEHLVDIYNEISKKGFDFYNKDKIIIVKKHGKMVCIHGKHRICMLYLIYGRNTTIELRNNTVVGIKRESH